ncbi:thioredoxin-like protein [Cladorrhinum samala]|uniref:Thioredoxin-like protein n=1 Tax=Cladorrhinum samala TaxID=585594 RepID=A0AAV9HTW4_9PEZI|nr:thioredoxin-like protein [Cladorrhinum samala]
MTINNLPLTTNNTTIPANPSSSGPSPITITIQTISDTGCPFCYLGSRTLSIAMSSYAAAAAAAAGKSAVTFQTTWSPFILYPRAPVSAISKHSLLSFVYGARASAMLSRLSTLGDRHGISFLWQGTTGNSRDSHRLILLAAAAAASLDSSEKENSNPSGANDDQSSNSSSSSCSKQDKAIETLFNWNFERAEDISDRAVLSRIGVELGIWDSEEKGAEWFGSEEAERIGRRVDEESGRARASGVVAAPSYVINGRWQVGGMQEVEAWKEIFERVTRMGTTESGGEESDGGGGVSGGGGGMEDLGGIGRKR